MNTNDWRNEASNEGDSHDIHFIFIQLFVFIWFFCVSIWKKTIGNETRTEWNVCKSKMSLFVVKRVFAITSFSAIERKTSTHKKKETKTTFEENASPITNEVLLYPIHMGKVMMLSIY